MAITYYNNWLEPADDFTFIVIEFEYSRPFIKVSLGACGIGIVIVLNIK